MDGIWVTEFTEASAKSFVESVRKIADKDEETPIVVYIDSYGGYVDACTTMLAILDAIPNKIITSCLGKAMSCGAQLLAHGDLRFASPHSRIMIHELSVSARGNINEVKNDAEENIRLNKYWNKILAENCGYTFKEFMALFTNERREIYLTAEKAKAFGIVDKIGFPKLEEHTTYKLVY